MDPIPHPLTLDNVQYHIQRPGTQPVPITVRPYREQVELVTGGRGWVRDGRLWREVTPGDVIWHAPGDQTIGRSDPDHPYSCVAVIFGVSRARGMGIRRFSKWPDPGAISALYREAAALLWNELFDQNALRDYLYARLLHRVRLYERSLKEARYPAPVAVVIARIERDFARPLRIGDLARESGWSVPHLHAEFQKHVQSTPHQFLIQQRVKMAREQLASTAAPISQVAADCGFGDLTSFGRVFKIHTGQTPSQFRRHHFPAK